MSTSKPVSTALPSWRQRNPSHSKTYLTRRNWSGQSLHATKSRNDAECGSDVAVESDPSVSASTMKESDISALPQSSDDEEDIENTEPPANVTVPSPKRKSPPLRQKTARRTKKPKLRDEPDVVHSERSDSLLQKKTDDKGKTTISQHGEFDMFMSSASQKRPMKTYKRVSRAQPPARLEPVTFKAPPPLSEATTGSERPSKTLRVPETVAAQQSEVPKRMLKTYALHGPALPSSTPASSAASYTSTLSPQAHDPDRLAASPRSSPATTPLSTNGHDLNEEDGNSSNVCPYCEKEVVRSRLSNPTIDLNELRYSKVRRLQDFCHEHSVADAKVFYESQRYPAIRWVDLKGRLTAYIPTLKQILQRETPSHFLRQIEARIVDKKNRKQLRNFLEQQGKDIDSFPPGYYGPKGTQIMAEVIAAELSHCLSGKDTDDTLKALGVGPYVAFVLVPECTTCLVMEDMGVSEEAARSIMRESSQAGMLIHPEDEIVMPKDDEE